MNRLDWSDQLVANGGRRTDEWKIRKQFRRSCAVVVIISSGTSPHPYTHIPLAALYLYVFRSQKYLWIYIYVCSPPPPLLSLSLSVSHSLTLSLSLPLSLCPSLPLPLPHSVLHSLSTYVNNISHWGIYLISDMICNSALAMHTDPGPSPNPPSCCLGTIWE